MAQANQTKWQVEMVQRNVNVENSNTCKGEDIKGEQKEGKGSVNSDFGLGNKLDD